MKALSSKMSQPGGMSSSYQSSQPIQHSIFGSNSHVLASSFPQHQPLQHQQQQQYAVPRQRQPASYPYSNNNVQTNGRQYMYGMPIPQRLPSYGQQTQQRTPSTIVQSQQSGHLKDAAQPIIKAEPIMRTETSQPDPLDVSHHELLNSSASKPMNFYKEVSPDQPNPSDMLKHGILNNNSSKPMNFYQEKSPSQPDPPDLSQQQVINDNASKIMNSYNPARPPGAYPQTHGVVRSQFPRTFIPPQQPHVSYAPRAPTNFGLTSLTQSLQNNVTNHVNNAAQNSDRMWVVTAKEFQRYSILFRKADLNRDGYVTGIEVRDVFIRTGLSQTHLIHIWDLVDTKQEGRLNCEQFALAMWFTMRTAHHKLEPPKKLTPEMIPPSMRVQAPVAAVTNVKPQPYKTKEPLPKPTYTRINNEMMSTVTTAKPSMVTIHREILPPGMIPPAMVPPAMIPPAMVPPAMVPPAMVPPAMVPPAMRVKAPVVSNFNPYKKEYLPKPISNTATKKSKPARPPKDDLFGCPNCLLMYDDSQHSPRELPCKHTFCIDCIDSALNEDLVKCGICGTSHHTLAAADFPINVYVEEMVRCSLEEKSEEERKKFIHDADACFFCVSESDEPPRKKIKVGKKLVTCDKDSSQETISSVGCEMSKTDRTLGNTENIDEIGDNQSKNNSIRDTFNENRLKVGCDIGKTVGGESGNTDNTDQIRDGLNENNTIRDSPNENIKVGDTCNATNSRVSCEIGKTGDKLGITDGTTAITDNCKESTSNLSSLSVLENDSRVKEKKKLSKELQTSCIDALVSNKQNIINTSCNMEENNERINSKENSMSNKLTTVENVVSKYSESSDTHNKLGTNHMDRLSSGNILVETPIKVNINNESTEKQRSIHNKSKIDENSNSISVDKFLEELL